MPKARKRRMKKSQSAWAGLSPNSTVPISLEEKQVTPMNISVRLLPIQAGNTSMFPANLTDYNPDIDTTVENTVDRVDKVMYENKRVGKRNRM